MGPKYQANFILLKPNSRLFVVVYL